MEMRKIGSLEVSSVGLGCNNFGGRIDAQRTSQVIHAALDAGINFFDTADMYGGTKSEQFLGRVLGERRKEVILATKFGNEVEGQGEGARPEYVHKAAEASLRRLGTDYIDLYQLHGPDPSVPIADTLGALDELVKAGKVIEIGCSNFTVEEIGEAEAVVEPGEARFVSVQNEYSLLRREPEQDVLPVCERAHLAFLPYFPLASGLLSGKYRKGQPLPEGSRITQNQERFGKLLSDENLDRVEALIRFAEARGHTLLELAFAWLLARPVVASVIAGATRPEQVHANVRSADWRLTEAELAQIDAIVPATA